MPQMNPMNWIILFIYFSSIYYLMNLIIYFNFSYNPHQSMSSLHNQSTKSLKSWSW
uniref:ATP synthase F0 subunit 8 n=1 Tax=Gunungiella acanthoclada TaxID=3025504 RepID=UPI00243561EA|nr:ATP synthase F0 subunit 8 [Gunungiella acanthoclada]WEU80053.1 ATP synthase F0 subunit 8 [Gunungiella acanthoclada]